MRSRIAFAAALMLLALVTFARAELKLPGLFTDHAVLQADTPVPVWGWADAGQTIEVAFGDTHASATAAADGKWLVRLSPMKASDKPATLTIKAGNETKQIEDVLVGEVWIGSGQSNMGFTMKASHDAEKSIAAANVPTIRLFTVPRRPSTQPADHVAGEWLVCTPKSVTPFSAVLYHFGRNVHDELKTPVGLINSSWGGTPIQAWMPRDTFASDDEIAKQRARILVRYPNTTSPATKQSLRPSAHLEPTKLFNGMIAPLVPYAIRGVTWYQGENNVHQGDVSDYATMMQSMIGSWRKLWGEGNFPFLYAQIAPYAKYAAGSSMLPEMWEQQSKALSIIPNSGMAAISDLGDPNDIHPKNKREVGRRLALIALEKTYKQPSVASDPPIFSSATREGSNIRVHFTGTAGGLKSRDGQPLDGFEIAGADGKFAAATATISGSDVIVECGNVSDSEKIRFAWSNIAAPNLVNGAGLPAVAFRADVK